MQNDIKARIKRSAALLAVALIIGASFIYFESSRNSADVVTKGISTIEPMAGVAVGGPFSLLNDEGIQVNQVTYSDKFKLIFFGFTYCPAICPGELTKMGKILEALGPETSKIHPIFISIDPERDSVEVVKEYMQSFDSRIEGLTGSIKQVNALKDNYKVYATKVENEMMSDYMIDHSSFMYFMSPDDQLITLYPLQETAEDIASDLRSRLSSS